MLPDCLKRAPDPFLLLGLDGAILDANPVARAAGLAGPRLSTIVDHSDGARAAEDLLETISCGLSWHGELPLAGRLYRASGWACGEQAPSRVNLQLFEVGGYQRRTADALRSRDNLLGLIEAMPVAVGVARDGRIVFANSALLDLLGWTASDLVGEPWDRLFGDHDPAPDTVERGQDVSCFRQDGSVLSARRALLPVRFDGHAVLAFTLADLEAERRAATRARETDRMVAIGTLAAGIAHEINTPIQFVGDSCEFVADGLRDLARLRHEARAALQEASSHPDVAPIAARWESLAEELDLDYLDEQMPAAIERMRDGIRRVATIVQAMKEFGHPGSDELAPADLERSLQNTTIVARNEIKYFADLAWDLCGLPPVVCNIGLMNQVFLNLLVNAAHAVRVRHEPAGTRGTITMRTRQEDGHAIVSIQDDGTGIPASVRARVFDPFFTTKPPGRGTGQGLAIARSVIVERHGGALWFETEEGVGTTFFVRLPMAERA